MELRPLPGLLAILILSACSSAGQEKAPPLVGGDRDAHGCIASAGYSWCAKTNQCEMPWELAKQNSFELSQEAYDDFCRVAEDAG